MTELIDKYDAGEIDIDKLFEEADVLETTGTGIDVQIFKGEKLDSLVDIPFIVTGGTFREGFQDGKKSDFVTLMCILPSEEFLTKRKIRYTETELWFPGQKFGINDGSTGIRRQVVSYLHGKGIIQVVEDGTVIVEDGPRGECTWDMLVSEWEKPGPEELPFKTHKRTGTHLATWDFSLEKPLMANRGIRKSTYMGPYRKEITTRYLA